MRYNKKHGVFLLTALLFAIILCSTASAAINETNTSDANSSIKTLQAHATVNSTGTQNTNLPAYSGNASSYVLNVGVLPNVLLDVYAGKSNSTANSTTPYASSENTPLEVKLLNGNLLSGLLNVKSTGDQGTVTGGITPSNLPALLQVLGLKVGLLNSTAYSSTHPPQANGASDVASVDLNLLNLLPVLKLGLISASSNVTPNSNVTALISSSKAGVADITLLGGVLQIKALQVNATASANGQPGGANAKFNWSVADILLNGKSILSDLKLKLKVDLPGVLTISIGSPVKTVAADGTYARVSGDAINVQLLGLLLGGVKLTIGHAEAAAQFMGNPNADLSLTKTVDDATPAYLQNVTFTLTAHNNGPADATNVTVNDLLPTGLQFVSTDGNYDPTTGVWTVGNLANGATAILHIVAQAIAANTQLTNVAVIGGNQTDQNSSNNQGSVNITVGPASDLGIKISVNNAHPAYLAYVTFTLTASNNGPNDAPNVKVYNTLPAGLRYVSDDSNGKFNSTSGLWSVGPMVNGASTVLRIVAQAMVSNATMTCTAHITDPPEVGINDFYDHNSSNDYANVTVDVGPATDPAIAITASKPRCNCQDKVMFTLNARNNGPDDATGVTVIAALPNGLKFVSADGAYNSTTGTWTIGNLAKGTTATLHLEAQATGSRTTVTTSASVFGYELDTNNTNNQANVTTILDPVTDLSITKTADKATVNYLNNVTFTLTAHNSGPNDATGVTVTDKLPTGLKFVSASGNGIYDSSTGVWTVGNLSNGATAALKIIAQAVVSNTQLTNVAIINPNTAANENDLNTTNNQGNVTVTVNPASDLSISKTVDNAHPNYLQNVTFTLTAHNNGPNNATGVVVNDVLPTGLRFISADGAYDSATGKWTIGNLSNGATAILHILAQVMISNGQVTNIASINETNYDQNSTNNQNNSTVVVGPSSDLSMTKTASSSKINYLGKVTFTLTAHNNGPDAATGVVVTDKLPAGLKFISADAAYDSVTGKWNVGNLANGATATLHIVAQGIVANTALTNVAVVSGTNYDQNSTNNQGSVTVNVGEASDLGITMTTNNLHPAYLAYVTLTLTASNYGPSNAPNVKVYLTLPNGLRFVSADGAYNATYNSTSGLWSIGPMAVGDTKTLHIVAQAMISNIVLTAKAFITDPPANEISNPFYDPNSGNDYADVSLEAMGNETPTKKPTKTIPLQPTGIPLAGMLLAALMVFAGIARRK